MRAEPERSEWKRFLRKHWGVAVDFTVTAVVALVGAVYVFLWFVGNAQSTGLVPSSLGLWTTGNLVAFIVYAILWELLFIGIPVIIVGVLGWWWWSKLPIEEREYRLWKRSGRARGGGGVSLLFFIAFCIKVYVDGNWNAPIATFTLNYVVGSMVLILAWLAVIFGIPAAVFAVWWVRREMKRRAT